MHEYLEEQAGHRLTWIVIWLIVAACLVEAVSTCLTLPHPVAMAADESQGEVVARMVFHTLPRKSGDFLIVKGGNLLMSGMRSLSG